MSHFLILGSHPQLSLAEIRAVLPESKPLVIEEMAVLESQDWDGEALQNRLAGIVGLGEVVLELPMKSLDAEGLAEAILARPRAEKIVFGLTIHGKTVEAKKYRRTLPLELKRALQAQGKSVRWFRDQEGGVSPAAVAKLDLIREGYDLHIAMVEGHAIIGFTTHVQDADAWSLRDYGRPFRDAKTGMLPPKLARMMTNLALPPSSSLPGYQPLLLDPFCGSGTILMEAALLDQRTTIIGSDIDERQIAGCIQNMDWLGEKKLISDERRAKISCFAHPVETLDAVLRPGQGVLRQAQHIIIVTEGFLGHPLQGNETQERLTRQVSEIEALWKKALTVFAKIQSSGDKVVCVWPSFQTSHGTASVDLTADLDRLGYRLMEAPLIYARPDQHVKRKIFRLEKTEHLTLPSPL